VCYITDMALDMGLTVDIGPVADEERQRWYTFFNKTRSVGKALGRPAAVEFMHAYDKEENHKK
jgi:hypothetical protein